MGKKRQKDREGGGKGIGKDTGKGCERIRERGAKGGGMREEEGGRRREGDLEAEGKMMGW